MSSISPAPLLAPNVPRFYAYSLLSTLSFWFPVAILYYQACGLTYGEIMLLVVVQSVFQFALEVPSGVVADRWGRKYALLIAAVSKVVFLALFLLGDGVGVFILASAVLGIHLAFESGSDSAFLYDTLKSLGREAEYRQHEGKAWSYRLGSMGVGSLIGGAAAEVSLRLPVLLTLLGSVAALAVALTFREPPHHRSTRDKPSVAHMRHAAGVVWNSGSIRYLVLFSGFMGAAMLTGFKFSQPYMHDAGVDLKFFGAIYFVWMVSSAVAARNAHRLAKWLGESLALLTIPVLLAAHYFFLAWTTSLVGVAIILISQVTSGLVRPLVNDAIHRDTPSSHRATVMSFAGFFQSLVLMALSPLFGVLADRHSLAAAFGAEGLFVVVAGLIPLALLALHRPSAVPAPPAVNVEPGAPTS
ncbi:MDR-type permease [Myxococcus hansupus]|uniref:MDR-type permease n=1 Tax=Pseudomyxococcus hansupus TaxID=1297742 RepID=A0A0H4X2U6_9BACT|nr:MFS transporter [Myxococcus hansupus]AKQ67970.1 MDR-type permease [Myxococcus hansupus]